MYSVTRHLRWQKKEENIKTEKIIFPKAQAYAIADIFLIPHIYAVHHFELEINIIKCMHINYLWGSGCDITLDEKECLNYFTVYTINIIEFLNDFNNSRRYSYIRSYVRLFNI